MTLIEAFVGYLVFRAAYKDLFGFWKSHRLRKDLEASTARLLSTQGVNGFRYLDQQLLFVEVESVPIERIDLNWEGSNYYFTKAFRWYSTGWRTALGLYSENRQSLNKGEGEPFFLGPEHLNKKTLVSIEKASKASLAIANMIEAVDSEWRDVDMYDRHKLLYFEAHFPSLNEYRISKYFVDGLMQHD